MGPHFVPSKLDEMTCTACSETINVGGMRVVPLVDDLAQLEARPAEPIPWEDSKKLGSWKAWLQTCWMSMFKPTRLGERIRDKSPESEGITFVLCSWSMTWVCQFIGIGVFYTISTIADAWRNSTLLNWWQDFLFLSVICLFFAIITVPMAMMAMTFIVILPAHLILKLTGSKRGGLGITTASVMYGQGASIIGCVPVIGLLLISVWGIWTMASGTFILHKAQKVSLWRAAGAILCGPIVCFALWVTLNMLW